MHRQLDRGLTLAQAASSRPAQDDLPSALADVEECVARLKVHVDNASLPQSIRRKIQVVSVAVQSLRANVDAEYVLPTASSPPERSEFNCVDVAMEKLKKRIRAGIRKRIVIDSEETESEPEQAAGPSVPSLLIKTEDLAVKQECRSLDEASLVAKKKRKRIIRMSSSSDDECKPLKVKAPPPRPAHTQHHASDTDTDDGDTTGALSYSNPVPSQYAQNSTSSLPKVEPPPIASTNDADKFDVEPTVISPAAPTIRAPPSYAKPTRPPHDPSTYSGDSSDDDIARPAIATRVHFLTSTPRSQTPAQRKSPPKLVTSPSVSANSSPRDAKSPLSASADPSRLCMRRLDVLSNIHTSHNHMGISVSDNDNGIVKLEQSHDSPVRGAANATPAAFLGQSTSPPNALPTIPSNPGPVELASPAAPPCQPQHVPSPLSHALHTTAIMVVSNSCADNNPPVQKVTSNDVEAVIEVSSSDSSSDSSSGKPAHKRRVSVWHTTPVGQTSAAKASSDDDSSSSSDDEAPARQPILSRRPTLSNAGGNTLASPHRGPLWPSLDKFIAMLVSPSRPRLLPDHFVFPKTYSSVAHYMSGLQQAIVEESLCAFDSKSNKQSRLTTASIVAVSPYNALLQSVLFRLPKPNKSKSKSPSVSTPTLLQSHDVLLLRPKSSRMSSESYNSNAGIPGIAMSTSLTQEDIVVLVSTAHSIDTLLSYDIYLIGNLTTGSREYQAALSLPSWPASLQSILTSAVIPTSTSLGMVPPSLIPSLRKHFNDHQFKAIQMAIHQPMTLIQGPPGTGKTHTILGIIQALLLQPSSRRAKISVGAALGVNTQPDIRLLVTAPSNAAVNVILHKIQAQYPDLAMVRLGQPTSSSLVWLENLIEFDKSKKLVGNDWSSQEARERLLDGAQVVFCTLSGAGSWSMWNPKRSHFDAVIVDEAAQATEASSLIPLRFCAQRYILVGDHKQLPATILSTRLSRMDYDHSLFQRLVNNRANDVIMLREQYRMHPDIASLPSRMFYSNDLVNVHHHPPDTVYHTAGFPPYMFYDVMDGAQSRVETSYRNVPEVSFIATRLKALLKIPYDFKNKIGIISPYKSQIEAIKEALDEAKLSKAKIEVNTVDGFQGREKEIIIVSCVRTLRGGDNSFWGDVRRMNVSLTRAISSCWVVGNSNLLQESPAWAELLDDCKRRGVYHKVAAQTPVKAAPTSLSHGAGLTAAAPTRLGAGT
ncbi:hypothetical protein H310_05733 [Aphanomyces invadans]|uniref:AAA+ ATPase domain-containing protein n=1 Tax=Aphanomyces invadans TaxID=157072 RepID=A0A024U7B3_9STRA|nr:hypothetical protein H310_05733 [Aphanomyces invadans]ETW02164.1 hypothetical protein H310_05733 [Aphanomyces invadans]|eukprot:XP_008868769.1 hypothetical protein H310_05733 [Aphanomyces invadans]